jgi:peptidoglycan/LPS O-acetylase OafA/YrhL
VEPTATESPRRHRRDIQGLRAVAVTLVVLRHADVPGFGGGFVGVDVFFVLSGFLITGLLLAEAEKGGAISFVAFYVRRARRILPAAALVLVATDVVVFFLLNFVRARDAVVDGLYAAGFAANFHFAEEGTNYFAQTKPPSPLLHYWTLAVEEQFYFAWPALLALVLLGGASFARHRRRLLVVVVALGAVSLAYSVHSTAAQSVAYFSPFTRAWELAFGAALAVAAPAARSARVASALGWAGLTAIVIAATLFTESTPFPGYAALLPTAGAVLLIWAGTTETSLARLLSVRPLRFVGDRSYALYLWHWPVLIVAAQYAGHEPPARARGMLVLLAFVLAVVSYALVEHPVHRARWSPLRTTVAVGAAMVVVVVTAMTSLSALDAKAARFASEGRPAAAFPAPPPTAQPPDVLPQVVAAVDAARSRAPIPSRLYPPLHLLPDHERLPYRMPAGCMPAQHSSESSSRICAFGRTASRRSIVLLGDSHAQMWLPPVLRLAKRDGWVVYPILRRGCTPITWIAHFGLDACRTWYGWAREQIRRLHPTVAIVTGNISQYHGKHGWLAARSTLAFARAASSGARRVIIVGDPEGLRKNPIDCLLRPHATMRDCTAVWWPAALWPYNYIRASAKRLGYGFVDSRGWFCFEAECPPVIGHTVIYGDERHVTAAYALTIAEPFRAAFNRAAKVK